LSKKKTKPRDHFAFESFRLDSRGLGDEEKIKRLLGFVSDVVVHSPKPGDLTVFPVINDFKTHRGHPFFVGIAIFGGYAISIETVPGKELLTFSGFSEIPWLEMEKSRICKMAEQLFGTPLQTAAEA
jgi:hypothetical protein